MCMLRSLSVDEILLTVYIKWSTHFRGSLIKVEIALSCLKHIHFVLSTFMEKPVLLATHFRLTAEIWLEQVNLLR